MSLLIDNKQNSQRPDTIEAREIIIELRRLEQQIRENEVQFNMTLENDLLEACIYDGKALRSRYRYYHNMARKMGIQVGKQR